MLVPMTLVLGGAFVLAACGSGGSSAAAGASATTAAGTSGVSQAYTDCLKQQGVDQLPQGFGQGRAGGANAAPGEAGGQPHQAGSDGTTTDNGTPRTTLSQAERDKLQAALNACRQYAPQDGSGVNGPFGGGGSNGQAFQAYASCMRDRGIEVGPGFRGSGASDATTTTGSAAPPSTVNRNDPAYQAADQVCRALLPAENGSDASTSTTTTPQP